MPTSLFAIVSLLAQEPASLTAAPATAPPAPPAPAAPPTPSAPAAPPAPERFVDLHGLVQIWYLNAFDDREPYVNLGPRRSSLRLRRAEIKIEGQVSRLVAFKTEFDPARAWEFQRRKAPATSNGMPTGLEVEVLQPPNRTSIVEDAYITFKHVPYVELSAGQGKTPISAEGLTSSSRLLFAERSEVGRFFGYQRDIGAWASYKFPWLSYQVGIYNGSGMNTLDTDRKKDVAARLEVRPLPGLQVAASVQQTMTNDDESARTLWGGDIRFEWRRLFLQAEAYTRKLPAGPTRVQTTGGYGAVAYTLTLGPFAAQPALRLEWFNPDGNVDKDDFWRGAAGVNLLLQGYAAKLAIDYLVTDGAERPAAMGGGTLSVDNHLLLLMAQVAF